jgi:hypothetical protein
MRAWKIKREINRFKQQCHSLALRLYEPWVRYQHDKHIHEILKVSYGSVASTLSNNYGFGQKVALFLIYQPNSIAASTHQTCEHLIAQGYSVLLVCNHSISEQDRAHLSKCVTIIIERPNFGYDFGGYRDGIRYLKSLKINLSNLIILNDSIWYPVSPCPKDTLIARMEASEASFLGALHMKSDSTSSIKHTKPPFFGSFFLMIKKEVYDSDLFTQYWNKYAFSSSKYLTIKRGERKFSELLLNSKNEHNQPRFRSEYFYDKAMLFDYIDTAERVILINLLAHSITLDPALIALKTSLLAQTTQLDALDLRWDTDCRNTLKSISNKQNILSTQPMIALTQFGVPYLKKSLDPHNRLALTLLAQPGNAAQLQLYPNVLEEIKQRL